MKNTRFYNHHRLAFDIQLRRSGEWQNGKCRRMSERSISITVNGMYVIARSHYMPATSQSVMYLGQDTLIRTNDIYNNDKSPAEMASIVTQACEQVGVFR